VFPSLPVAANGVRARSLTLALARPPPVSGRRRAMSTPGRWTAGRPTRWTGSRRRP